MRPGGGVPKVFLSRYRRTGSAGGYPQAGTPLEIPTTAKRHHHADGLFLKNVSRTSTNDAVFDRCPVDSVSPPM
jgi:hypothetical protein